MQSFSAAMTLPAKVVQCVRSDGVPPLKWYLLDQFFVPPLYGMDLSIRIDGVSAMHGGYSKRRTRSGLVPSTRGSCRRLRPGDSFAGCNICPLPPYPPPPSHQARLATGALLAH